MAAEASGKLPGKPSKKNPYKKTTESHAYLQLQYYDPVAKSDLPFPQNTPVNIIYVDEDEDETFHSNKPLKTKNAEGKISFKVEQKTNLYFEIVFEETTYLNISKKSYMSEKQLAKSIQDDNLYLTKEMLFLLPKKVSMKNSWWDLGEHPTSEKPFYDEKRRLFTNLKANKIKGKSGHLKVTLKPDWQYVSFSYFDCHKKSEQIVPQFLMLEGYNEDVDDDVPVARSNLFKNKCVCLPWIEDKNRRQERDPDEIVLKFITSDAFVESDGGPKIGFHKFKDILQKTLTERFKYYDLPQKWESKNWLVKFGTKEKLFRDVVNEKTNEAQHLIIDLDSVVLTDDDLDCESWDKDNRFTVFDLQMIITNPDTPNRPYWTKGTSKSNFFTKSIVGTLCRVIAVNGKFYDVTHKRSKDGDIIGARAAVKDDKDVHFGKDLTKPVCNIGNFDLHYFVDCLDSAGAVTPVLLIYWSCEFDKESGVTEADIEKFRKHGMTNSKTRWEKSDYKFKIKGDPSGMVVRPLFFFEGRENAPYKCSVDVNKPGTGRSYMGISSAGFKTTDYKPTSSGWFTMAHELGHAIGLNDEYVESLEEDSRDNGVPPVELWNPSLPQFDQYYPGMPYSFDDDSLMVVNQDCRLRHFWYFCRWLNETEGVKNLSGQPVDKKFQVIKNASGATTYEYFLKDYTKDFYKPAYSEEDFKNGNQGIFDLFLYKIGNDETTAKIHPSHTDCDSILAVRFKLQWFFDDYLGNAWPDILSKLRYIRKFQKKINKDLNNKFYLDCPPDYDFKKVYVFFTPHHYFEGSTIYDHFEVSVKRNTGPSISFKGDLFKTNFKKDEFEVDQNHQPVSIARYVLGLQPYDVVTTGTTKTRKCASNITRHELGFLAKWVEKKRNKGHSYTVKTF